MVLFPVSLTIVPELFTVELSSAELAALITLFLAEPLIFMVPWLSIVNPEAPTVIQLLILVHVNDPDDVIWLLELLQLLVLFLRLKL